MNRFSPEEIDRIVALGERSYSGGRIARRMGLSEASVNYRLLRNGIDPWPNHAAYSQALPRRGRPFTAEEDARMLALLTERMPMYKIAITMKRPRTSVLIRILTLEVRAEKALEAAA
jgi:transposase-like protein